MSRKPQTRLWFHTILGLLLLLILVGCGGLPAAPNGTPSSAALAFSASSIKFGNVTIGSSSTKNLTLTNNGNTDVTVQAAGVSGPGFSVTGSTFPRTIAGGSQLTLSVKFAPAASGVANGSLAVQSTATDSLPAVTMSGEGMTPPPGSLTLSKTSIDFGNVLTGGSSSQKIVLTNSSSMQKINVSSVSLPDPAFKITGVTFPLTIAESGSASLNVVFKPTTAGAVSGNITFASNASNAPSTLAVIGSGEAPASLNLSTASLDFGTVTTGSTKSLTVTLSNSSPSIAINVSSATASGTGYSVSGATFPLNLAGGASQTLTVTYAPSKAGTATGSISIASNAANPSASIALTGEGQSPAPGALVVSPTSLDFGTVTVGSKANQTFSLTNSSSSASITVNSATASGTGYSVSGATFPLTLAGGASKTLTVAFSPSSAGTATGSVSIASNASNPSASVALTGVGQSPAPGALVVSPTSLDFGTVTVGNKTNQTFSLTNSSSSASITVNSVTASGTGYSVSGATFPLTLAGGASKTLTVAFSPSAAGTATGSVSIASNASNPSASVALTGVGQASAPVQLTVSPTSLDFGTVTVGNKTNQTITLTNGSSTSSLTVNSAAFAGNEYAVSGTTFPLTLAAGASKTVTIAFTPASSGTATDSLSIVSSASNSPATVTVTGVGQAPPSHSVTLTWNASTSTVVGYNVYRGDTSGGPYSVINSVLATSAGYTDSEVTAGSTYFYVITAVDASNTESDPSTEASAKVPTP